ncbi:MAG: hypothetical protein IT189_08015 [Microbacteriaceae bacterium]|nr:hypothetical protein [Microbacteriaceae bacterium]HOY82347.1 hypothetical protein [Rhodoglobus sp.]
MSRTHAPLALLVALTLALTGCGGAQKMLGKAGPSPAPTAAFASEEEALAAAVAVYDRFRSIGDEIGHDGGRDAERLEEVATGGFLKVSVEGFTGWIDKGWHQVGSSTFRDVTVQQYSDGPADAVVLYLCDDISEVDVLDETGASVASPDRPDTNYLQVSFDVGKDGVLRVSDSQRWDERTC